MHPYCEALNLYTRHSILEPRHIPAPLDVNIGPQQFTGSSASFLPKTKCLPNLPKQKNSRPEIFLCKKANNFRLYVMKESRGGVVPRSVVRDAESKTPVAVEAIRRGRPSKPVEYHIGL